MRPTDSDSPKKVTASDGKRPFSINSLYALFYRDFYKKGFCRHYLSLIFYQKLSKPNTGGGFHE